MKIAFITRGYDQQLDYNVMEDAMPWGERVATRIQALSRLRTSPSDFSFSFVAKRDESQWEMLINAIQTNRHDFAGSPLRTYLYLSGDVGDEDYRESIQLASNILVSEISDYWPQSPVVERSRLGRCMDAVITDDVVKGMVSWKGASRIDAEKWSHEILLPALKGDFSKAERTSPNVSDMAKAIDALLSGNCGVITGEFLPYLNSAQNKIRNFKFHFSDKTVVMFSEDGGQKKTPPPTNDDDPPPPPPPPPLPPSCWRYITIVAVGTIVLLTLFKSCRKPASEQDVRGLSTQKTLELTTNSVSVTTNSAIKTKGN